MYTRSLAFSMSLLFLRSQIAQSSDRCFYCPGRLHFAVLGTPYFATLSPQKPHFAHRFSQGQPTPGRRQSIWYWAWGCKVLDFRIECTGVADPQSSSSPSYVRCGSNSSILRPYIRSSLVLVPPPPPFVSAIKHVH